MIHSPRHSQDTAKQQRFSHHSFPIPSFVTPPSSKPGLQSLVVPCRPVPPCLGLCSPPGCLQNLRNTWLPTHTMQAAALRREEHCPFYFWSCRAGLRNALMPSVLKGGRELPQQIHRWVPDRCEHILPLAPEPERAAGLRSQLASPLPQLQGGGRGWWHSGTWLPRQRLPEQHGGVKSSAGHGVRQGVRILNQPMRENRCQGRCCPVQQPGLLLLRTGIGAENADNFVNLLLTHSHGTLHSDITAGAPTLFSFTSNTVQQSLLAWRQDFCSSVLSENATGSQG